MLGGATEDKNLAILCNELQRLDTQRNKTLEGTVGALLELFMSENEYDAENPGVLETLQAMGDRLEWRLFVVLAIRLCEVVEDKDSDTVWRILEDCEERLFAREPGAYEPLLQSLRLVVAQGSL